MEPRIQGNGEAVPQPKRAAKNGTSKAESKPIVFNRTELDMAEMLVKRSGRDLRYCKNLGGWYAWTGTHWERDEAEHARECCKELARYLAQFAIDRLDKKRFKEAQRCGSAAGCERGAGLGAKLEWDRVSAAGRQPRSVVAQH